MRYAELFDAHAISAAEITAATNHIHKFFTPNRKAVVGYVASPPFEAHYEPWKLYWIQVRGQNAAATAGIDGMAIEVCAIGAPGSHEKIQLAYGVQSHDRFVRAIFPGGLVITRGFMWNIRHAKTLWTAGDYVITLALYEVLR